MLKIFRLKNFKLHQDTSLEFGGITVLIGPQGAGKSTVLQALRMLKQSSKREGLSLTGPFEGLGFSDIIHQRKDRLLLTFGLELSCAGAPAFLSETGEFDLTYDISFDNTGFRTHRCVYKVGSYSWEFRTPKMPGRWSVPEEVRLENRPPVKFYGSTYTLLPFRYKIEERDYVLHRGFNDLRVAMSDFFQALQMVPESRLITKNVYPVTPFEGAPRTIEEVVNRLCSEWENRDQVSEYLNKVLGRRINFRAVKEEIEVEVANGTGGPHPVMCEGGGLRSLVWPLAAISGGTPGSLVAIEEPEIHLHPKAIAEFCDILVMATKEKDIQFLLTTHDEHLIFSLLLAVAESELTPDDLRIYYLEEKAGQVITKQLEVDEKGSVAGGLPGFFEAGLDQLEGFFAALKQKEGSGR